MKLFLKCILLSSLLLGCGESKEQNTSEQETSITTNNYVFSKTDIGKYALAAIMKQDPKEITISDIGGVLFASFEDENDGNRLDYKVRIKGDRIIWGEKNGDWRTADYDQFVTFSQIADTLKIVQRFEGGRIVTKRFTKTK